MSRRAVSILVCAFLVLAVAGPAAAAEPQSRPAAPDFQQPVRLIHEAEPTPGPATTMAVPNGTVGVLSSAGYLYGDGSSAVLGEVQNRTGARQEYVNVIVTYFDAGLQVIGSRSEFVILAAIARGAVGPFYIYEETAPPGWDSYTLEVEPGTATTTPPGGPLHIQMGPGSDEPGVHYYDGLVLNENPFAVEFTWAMLTAYDADGLVVDVTWQELAPDPIPAGSNAAFNFPVATEMGATRVVITADGWRADTGTYVTTWNNYFDDIGTGTFRNDIIWLAEHRITNGCGPGRYCPSNAVRRDEMASFLSRSLGLTGTPPDAFVDDNGNTHELNINRIAAEGITNGCNVVKKYYCPKNNVRRDEMASFLSRSLGLTGTPPNAFVDDNGNTHELNINRIAAEGITTGCDIVKQLYCPAQLVTRGQMAAFLRRSFE